MVYIVRSVRTFVCRQSRPNADLHRRKCGYHSNYEVVTEAAPALCAGKGHMGRTIRIAIVDDHPIYIAGLKHAFQAASGISVVAQGHSLDDAVLITQEHAPDILLLDVAMPGNGIEAAKQICSRHPRTRVIMLSGLDDDSVVMQALGAGALGYVVKGASRSELCDAIKAVDGGESYISARLATRYALEFLRQRQNGEDDDPQGEMSPREMEVFRLAREGLSNKEIARKLQLSLSTVKNNMSRVLRKLNSRNRIEALQKCAMGD